MTVIAAMTLVALLIIMLLMIIGLVLWQKRASIQLDSLQEISGRLAVIEQEMQVLKKTVHAETKEVQSGACTARDPLKEDRDTGEEVLQPAEEDWQTAEFSISDVTENETPESIQIETNFQAQPEEELKRQEERSAVLDRKQQDCPKASKYNSGKSGKIYTEEELELLIKE